MENFAKGLIGSFPARKIGRRSMGIVANNDLWKIATESQDHLSVMI
tara:strand:- start:484 stop:621 length:138 start_codon:yes stop_codon:yes gene_type:complete